MGQALAHGAQALRGGRRGFFLFRLSFLVWFAISQVTVGAADLFIFPYQELSAMLYLRAAGVSGEPTLQERVDLPD